MRLIDTIFIHCSASSQKWGVKELWAEFKAKGWNNPGYHYAITADGAIHQMLPVELVSNGVQGHNSTSINVAYVGGIDSKGNAVDNRTDAQKKAMVTLLTQLKLKFPNAEIMGHRDVWGNDKSKWKKMCPCFNAKEEYKSLCV